MITKFVIAALTAFIVQKAIAVGKGGGGGSIDKMRLAGALSREQIVELLKDNGYLLKTQALISFFESIDLNTIKDNEIKKKFKLMVSSSPKQFATNVVWLGFRIDGCYCKPDENACRIDTPNETYSCFEVEKLFQNLTSFSELAGISVHEVSRLTIPRNSPYQDDNHSLAKFVSYEINSGKHSSENIQSKIFSECTERVGSDRYRIEACKNIKNLYALKCVIGRGVDRYTILACASIDNQDELKCALNNGSDRYKIDNCNLDL